MQNPFVANALNDIPSIHSSHLSIEPPLATDADTLPPSTTLPENTSWTIIKDPKTGSVMTDSRLRIKLRPSPTSKSSNSASDPNNPKEAVLTNAYALGDCAILAGTTYPATAQVAYQKAVWLAKRLNKDDLSKPPLKGFSWKNMGVMAYLGNWNALLQGGGGGGISGRAAWVIWRGAYLTKSVSLRNKILIPVYWFINWVFGRDIVSGIYASVIWLNGERY